MSFTCGACGADTDRLQYKEIDEKMTAVCPDCKSWKGKIPHTEGELKKGVIR